MPGGQVYTTENGCFAKTFGLDPEVEPAIYNATTKPDAYLENVSVDANGKVDFFDTSYTKNGRTTWPFSYVDPWPGKDLPPAEFLLILNRNENIVPGRGAGWTAPGGGVLHARRDHRHVGRRQGRGGQVPRVPGTNPFFPRDMADMGNRMLELLESHELKVFVLNTGRIGGTDEGTSKKVTIPYSSATVQAIVEDTIEWDTDPDFGYEIAASLPGSTTLRSSSRASLYERQGRRRSTTRWSRASSASARSSSARSPGWTRTSPSRSADCRARPRGPAAWRVPAARRRGHGGIGCGPP